MLKLNNKGNWTLIGLLVSVAIVVVVAAMYFGTDIFTTTVKGNSSLLDQSSKKKTTVGKAIDTAKAADCQERLRQIRMGIQNYKITSDANPPAFKDIGLGVSNDYFQCPVSNQPYKYDPATGTLSCPTHPSY